ncbi:hypothetical protein JOM56_003873 [Amanita muscaria]
MIDPDEDFHTIVAAEESIAASHAKRKEQLEEAHAKLKALSRALEAARVSAARPPSVPSAGAHAALVDELDSSKLSLMKAISDAEGMIADREAELTRLKEEARKLEDYDPSLEHEKELDSLTIRLQLYKGLGFEPVAEAKSGDIAKMLVRSRSGDLHSVNLANEAPPNQITDLLWKLLAS